MDEPSSRVACVIFLDAESSSAFILDVGGLFGFELIPDYEFKARIFAETSKGDARIASVSHWDRAWKITHADHHVFYLQRPVCSMCNKLNAIYLPCKHRDICARCFLKDNVCITCEAESPSSKKETKENDKQVPILQNEGREEQLGGQSGPSDKKENLTQLLRKKDGEEPQPDDGHIQTVQKATEEEQPDEPGQAVSVRGGCTLVSDDLTTLPKKKSKKNKKNKKSN